MKLTMNKLRAFNVPEASLAVWWLGQASFIVKSPSGVIAAIDPYLTNSCKMTGESIGINFDRLIAAPLEPEELVGIDLYVMTHSHQDHLDPETLGRYRHAGGKGPYVAPAETVEKLKEASVPEDDIIMTWPNKTHKKGDLNLRATFAVPFGPDDMTHVGYLVSADEGPTFYFTGDTFYEEILGTSVAERKPDVMFTVINGVFRNMGPAEAARLAKQVNPRIVIPYHYDLFPDGQMRPELLKTNLLLYGMQDRFKLLKHGEPFVFSINQDSS